MAFKYRLFDVGGSDLGTHLGTFASSEPNGAPGNRIHRGPGDALVVVRLVPAEEGDDVIGYLIVKGT